MSLSAGARLDRYEIRSKIGEGGRGEVYLAQDTKLDRKVALKILPVDGGTAIKIMDASGRGAEVSPASALSSHTMPWISRQSVPANRVGKFSCAKPETCLYSLRSFPQPH